MSHLGVNESHEVIFLFQGDDPARELLYPEFEAILDGFIPIPEYAGIHARVVYAQFNSQLAITGAVFFLLGFDGSGLADRRWNLPLRQLLAAAELGPNLGAGPIRLVCYSQCPLAWQQKNLWDPCMEEGRNTFIALRDALSENRLGFAIKPAPADAIPTLNTADEVPHLFAAETIPTLGSDSRIDGVLEAALEPLPEALLNDALSLQQKNLQVQFQEQLSRYLAQAESEHQLRLATLQSESKAQLQAMQQEHQLRLESYRQQLALQESEKQQEQQRNLQLRDELTRQLNKVEEVRRYYSEKLCLAQDDEQGQLQALQASFSQELQLRLQESAALWREQLTAREAELSALHHSETQLKDEIARLKQEAQTLLGEGADQLLSRLAKADIHFVALQPGLGEVSIPQQDISRYLAKPTSYLAQQAGVSEAVYIAWREHFQRPCCPGSMGKSCAEPLARIENPLAFIPGESDRCLAHQSVNAPRVSRRY